MSKRVVLALGGNAILQPKQEASYENQYNNVYAATRKMAELKKIGHNVFITHGNEQKVGNIIAQNESAKNIVDPLRINACNAESQDFIGYMMEEVLKNHLHALDIQSDVVTLLTIV